VILSSASERVNESAGEAFGSAKSKRTTSCLPRSSTRIGLRPKTAGAKLGQEYFDLNLPVVRERFDRAGVRLATVLNECFE
jgi:hypothetical protein